MRQTWYGWLTGASQPEAANTIGSDDVGAEVSSDMTLNNEQRRALESLLSIDISSETEEEEGASSYVAHELKISLDQLSLTLLETANAHNPGIAAGRYELARLAISSVEFGLAARAAGVLAEGGFASVEMVDCSAPEDALGKALVRQAKPMGVAAAKGDKGPQWRIKFVQRPAGRTEDVEIAVSVASPLEVVHNAPLLARISHFFAVISESDSEEVAQLAQHVREQVDAHEYIHTML